MNRPTADPDAVFRALKPAALDGLTKDAHANRRDGDLGRALAADGAGALVPSRPRRHPLLLVAGVAAAAVVATGAAVALTGHDGHTAPAGHAPVASGPLDARGVLLTAAETAARIPATTGRFWYTRVRTQQKVQPKLGRLKPGRLTGAERSKLKPVPVPFDAYTSWTEDSWDGSRPTDGSRTTTGIDVATRFASPADEAKWKAMGSPPLNNAVNPSAVTRPVTSNYSFPGMLTVGGQQLSMKAMLGLPTTQKALEAELRELYTRAVNDPEYPLGDSFATTVWGTAQDLLSLPISSGTRSALFRILAEQPGVRLAGTVADPEGRRGIAVDMPVASFNSRMIIDPATTRLLAYEASNAGDPQPTLTQTYEATGWVSALGDRP